MKKSTYLFFTALCVLSMLSFMSIKKEKPSLYLIGDSTVDAGSGNNGLWGWGKYLPQFFDTDKISIFNYAQGGTSVRTFYTNGIWDKKINKRGMWDSVFSKIKRNDYLIIQFGLNDQGPIADSARARGTLKGIGNDSTIIFNPVTKQQETVYSFGRYLTKYIQEAKIKGVHVVVCSTIPRNVWKAGKVARGENGFAQWALDVATREGVENIDLHNLIADVYDQEGEQVVTQKYHIEKDKTHTTEPGAMLNASMVVKGIASLQNCDLKRYIKK